MSSRTRIGLTTFLTLAGCSLAGPDGFVARGTWGGDHVTLSVEAATAAIEFDCAHGTLPSPIALDDGRFDVTGMFVQERGGPIRVDDLVAQQPARYTGSVDGRIMTLRVRLADGLQDVGTYTLTRGASGRVFKCL